MRRLWAALGEDVGLVLVTRDAVAALPTRRPGRKVLSVSCRMNLDSLRIACLQQAQADADRLRAEMRQNMSAGSLPLGPRHARSSSRGRSKDAPSANRKLRVG